jgi:hypothetical protein
MNAASPGETILTYSAKTDFITGNSPIMVTVADLIKKKGGKKD